jgi:hypothetical protein
MNINSSDMFIICKRGNDNVLSIYLICINIHLSMEIPIQFPL